MSPLAYSFIIFALNGFVVFVGWWLNHTIVQDKATERLYTALIFPLWFVMCAVWLYWAFTLVMENMT